MSHGCNAGLPGGLSLLQPVKDAVPEMSWADLLQLGSAVAIEVAGGPHIPLRLGRVEAATEAECTPDGRLPAAAGPFADGSATPADHLRRVFHRMGLTDQDIVALSGAHTLGRAYPSRSGGWVGGPLPRLPRSIRCQHHARPASGPLPGLRPFPQH